MFSKEKSVILVLQLNAMSIIGKIRIRIEHLERDKIHLAKLVEFPGNLVQQSMASNIEHKAFIELCRLCAELR